MVMKIGKHLGVAKRRRKHNRKKKNTLGDEVEDGEKTPKSQPMEPKAINSTPKRKDQGSRKLESLSPTSHKKKGYETYWPFEMVSQGLKRGELFKRFNKD